MTPEQIKAEHKAFEDIISSSPYERDIKRFPDDHLATAWPGNYRDITTDLAWQIWRTRAEQAQRVREALEADAQRWRAAQSDPVYWIPKWVPERVRRHNHCTAIIAANVNVKAAGYMAVRVVGDDDAAIDTMRAQKGGAA
jgi:hypothetical protein